MKFTREDMLDLNEENIRKIFKFCMATKETPKENIILGNFIKKCVPIEIPNVPFNLENIRLMRPSIYYILGQLNFLHSKKLEVQPQDGFKKYDGTNWTKDKALLFSLYYVGCSSSVLPLFTNVPPSKELVCMLLKNPDLKPTLSPNDPNFEAWLEEHRDIWE